MAGLPQRETSERRERTGSYRLPPSPTNEVEEYQQGHEPAPLLAERFNQFISHRPSLWQRIIFLIAVYNLIMVLFRVCADSAAVLGWAVVDLILDGLMVFDFICNLMLPPELTFAGHDALLAAYAASSLIAATATIEQQDEEMTPDPFALQKPVQVSGPAPVVNLVGREFKRRPGVHWISTNLRNFDGITELCALMPLDIVGLILGTGGSGVLHPAFRLNKFIFRIPRINGYIARVLEEVNVSSAMSSIVRLLLYIVLAIHMGACLWMLVLRLDKVIEGGEETKTVWYWTQVPGVTDLGPERRYLLGFYWTLTMMTGYGSIIPQSTPQVCFCLLAVVIGIVGNVTVIGTLGNLVQNLDTQKTAYQTKMNSIGEYMTYRRVSEEKRERVMRYYSYLWKTRRGLDEGKLIRGLPHYLQEEVSLYINKEIISKVPLFHDCDEQFKSAVVVKLVPSTLLPESYIVRKGEVGREMFFISRGEVQVVSDVKDQKDSSQRIIYATLRDGAFFGEVALLLNDSRRTATVVSSKFCDLFSLRKEDFDLIRETFPQQSETIKRAAHKRYKLHLDNEADEEDD